MNSLAQFIGDVIIKDLANAADTGGEELRLIFHGPTLEILRDVFSGLIAHWGSDAPVPILLVDAQLDPGSRNPDVGVSGLCDASHLLSMRNSPNGSTFLALVPPGQHNIRSITSTADEIGVAPANNGGNIPFEEWWADSFVQKLVLGGLLKAGFKKEDADQLSEATSLVERAASAADDLDPQRVQRLSAWRMLSRLYMVGEKNPDLTPGQRVSWACGVPPMANGSVSATRQLDVLQKVADALSDGFGAGIQRIKEGADSVDTANLDAFLKHLRDVCDLPTAFERATVEFYTTNKGLDVFAPTDWWGGLSVEKWSDLLTEETAAQGDLEISCINPILSLPKNFPVIVEGVIELKVDVSGSEPVEDGTKVTIARGSKGKSVGEAEFIDEEAVFLDECPPSHRTPIRYYALAENYNSASTKVISLATWEPGLIVVSRQAKRLAPPRKPSRTRKGGPTFETSLVVPGGGRYELLVLTSPEVKLAPQAEGKSDNNGDQPDRCSKHDVRQIREGYSQIEIEAEGNYQLDIAFTRQGSEGRTESETCRVDVTVEDVVEQGCKSEYERLVRENRKALYSSGTKLVVQLNRSSRSSSFEDWLLADDNIAQSYRPIVLADDYVDAWVEPEWSSGPGPVLSKGRFLKDPRPDSSEFNAPKDFLLARKQIAARIRRSNDLGGLVESAELGKWYEEDIDFKSHVEAYLDSYKTWLSSAPDVACWVDVTLVTSLDDDGQTLSRVPDAILLSPLHPLRLAWHCLAQNVLLEALTQNLPCPAVSVLDPDCIVDVLPLALRSPDRIEWVEFLAVENSTDYWSVLWNGNKLDRLLNRSRQAPFGEAFGVTVGGISVGFSAAQVGRALEDVSNLLSAKPSVGVAVSSAGGTTDACNEGLIEWCTARYRDGQGRSSRRSVGKRFTEVYDLRDRQYRPDDATLANLSEDTNNSVRWFECQPNKVKPDLGIIAQLEMSEPGVAATTGRSPLGFGGLLRWRIRRQLPQAFINETRQCAPGPESGDVFADKIAACIGVLECLERDPVGMRFAPNVNVLQDMLEHKSADFVAVSSSAIDPASFLSGALEDTYLWDYDLPSYSNRSGDTNGYYLLSQIKSADREALSKALGLLPDCRRLDSDQIGDILLEIARRGIPTIKGLSGENSGATGDLGLFVAVRLLQDSFRRSNVGDSLLPIIEKDDDSTSVFIVVPVDPFQGYFADLARTIDGGKKANSLSRPDFLVIGIRLYGQKVSLHLTPIEVKCRPGSEFPKSDASDALKQAQTFSKLLERMLPHEGQPKAWALGFQHLLLSVISFGMRVYSQHQGIMSLGGQWARLHEDIAAAIMDSNPSISVDPKGRLIVMDDHPRSGPKDWDNDGFDETIVIASRDAGDIVAGDPLPFYQSVRSKIGRWRLIPDVAEVANNADEQIGGSDTENIEQSTQQPKGMDDTPPYVDEVKPEEPHQTGDNTSGILLSVGTTVDSFKSEELSLNISDTRLNQLNMGVVGDLGTGKTQLLKSLIMQISGASNQNRGIKPSFLIFDYKRDYSDPRFVEATGARVVRPHQLPLNLFDTSELGDVAAPWLDRFRFFADVLDKIYSGIGPVQRDKLKKAVRTAYQSCIDGQHPTLYDVHAAYSDLLDGKSDSPMAIIDDLIDMEIFVSSAKDAIPFNKFLDGVVVISLDMLGQDDRSKNMLVAVMLNMFYENMLRTPKRPFVGTDPQLRAINSYLLVDEADNIMRYEFDVLRKLLLQGREFGTGVILASQYLRHFRVGATDYREPLLSWFVHKVPNAMPSELAALGLATGSSEMAERVKSLNVHECLYKSFDVSGEVVRGVPFFELDAARLAVQSGD